MIKFDLLVVHHDIVYPIIGLFVEEYDIVLVQLYELRTQLSLWDTGIGQFDASLWHTADNNTVTERCAYLSTFIDPFFGNDTDFYRLIITELGARSVFEQFCIELEYLIFLGNRFMHISTGETGSLFHHSLFA